MGPSGSSKRVTYELAKKLGRLVLWFSVLTFFLSNPSWVSFFLRSFATHLSSFPTQILAHINNKNYIFLLCNGILVILAKSSRKTEDQNSETTAPNPDETRPIVEQGLERGLVRENEVLNEVESQRGDESKSDECCVEVENDLGEEGLIAKMSTEELNLRFDEFIRKMKEGIRVEAQQQLIMV